MIKLTIVKAMVYSKNALDDVILLEDCGVFMAQYQNYLCSAIFNPFSGLYYVDDIYGVIRDNSYYLYISQMGSGLYYVHYLDTPFSALAVDESVERLISGISANGYKYGGMLQ